MEMRNKPAKGKEKMLLEQMISTAARTVRCLNEELSGERDGDGTWHGSYPVGPCVNELRAACQEWLDWEKKVDEARHILWENEHGEDALEQLFAVPK